MREARDQTGSEWIGDHAMTMGMVDVARLAGAGRLRAVHDDHLDSALDQIGNQLRYPGVVAVGRSPLDHHIASLGRSPRPAAPRRNSCASLLSGEKPIRSTPMRRGAADCWALATPVLNAVAVQATNATRPLANARRFT